MHRHSCIPAISLFCLLLAAPIAGAEIVINEIMYNNPGTDVEFIELVNAGDSPVALDGWYLLDDDLLHPRCLLVGELGAGEYLVVAGDLDLFTIVYPDVTNYNPNDFDPGGLGWGLSNGGDTVHLFDDMETLVDIVAYEDGGDWPSSPDGNGPSLELIHPLLDNNLPTSWDPSVADGGSPGVINGAYSENQEPICQNGERDIALPTHDDAVTVTVTAWDNEELTSVDLMVDLGGGFAAQPMFDDGAHGDGAAGDSLWGAVIPPQPGGTLVCYYAIAEDALGQLDTWPGDAPEEYRAYTVDHQTPDLRITEILAKNETGMPDEFGQHDDWIEIYNAGSVTISLAGMFISDDLGSSRNYELPDEDLDPGDYLLIWADNEDAQGPLHADFKLSAGGEDAALFETVHHGNVLIDGFRFGVQSADVSFGVLPTDAHAPEYIATPTPGATNHGSSLFSQVCINEFQTTSDFGGFDDWVEVYNRGGAPVDISGWLLTDDRDTPDKWAFPPGTILESGEFLVVYEDALGFGWSSSGDEEIMLSSPDGLTGMDYYDMGPQSPDVSEGRYHDGQAYWYFYADTSPGAPNGDPEVAVGEGPAQQTHLRFGGVWPNPFNPRTEIHFSLSEAGPVHVEIYDTQGRRVRLLAIGPMEAGEQVLAWDGCDDRGTRLASGIYLLRVQARTQEAGAKLVLLK